LEYLLQPLALLTFPSIDPVIISIGPFDVRWYGLAYVVGILLGWWFARTLLERQNLWPNNTPPMKMIDLDDFILWAAIAIVAGGRIGYILFYDFNAVLENPGRIIEVWNGGMSFHGGVAGTLIAMLLFAKIRKIYIWNLFDLICAAAPIGIFFVRIANFINGELWGRLTPAPWAMIFPGGGPFPRHPSQLYEAALEGILLFIILAIMALMFKALKRPGLIAGTFVAFYACARIVVEFFREPDAHLGFLYGGWLTMGMLLSLPLLAVGLWGMLTASSRVHK
jgi:phosphatidylglycerol:prolipoprotein diacylglycerol transferase